MSWSLRRDPWRDHAAVSLFSPRFCFSLRLCCISSCALLPLLLNNDNKCTIINIIMQLKYLLSLLLLAVATLSSNVNAFHEEPSDAVRDHIKNTITEEDVKVMQAEMAWGAQEMRRYKSVRGGWPVRSAITGQEVAEEKETDREETLFRGGNKQAATEDSPHHEYWNYLISMF